MANIDIGRHLIIDCGNCAASVLNDTEAVRLLIRRLAEATGTLVLKEEYHRFTPAGVTGFAIVSASHIAAHTWPEYGYLGVDIFSCRAIDEAAVLAALQEYSPGITCHCRYLSRVCDETDALQ